jgi:hypothetical protein
MGAYRTSPGKECPIIWRGRRAKAFVPSMLDVRSIDLSSVTRSCTAVAAAEISSTAASMPSGHVPLARLLLRAEGVASSYLEGVAAPFADIVVAEADGGELATPAALVASNFVAITSAVDSAGDELTTEMLCAWQRTVVHGSSLPSRYVGVIRDEQGWIGGTSPLDAALVTSPPVSVRFAADRSGYLASWPDDVPARTERRMGEVVRRRCHRCGPGPARSDRCCGGTRGAMATTTRRIAFRGA